MRRVLTVEEMSAADAAAIEFGIPSLVLMERAALTVTEEMMNRGYDMSRVLVLCGMGNNAGDGAAIARMLAEKGMQPEIMIFGAPEKRSGQLNTQLKICDHYNIKYADCYESGKYTLVVDALFGIGLKRDITGSIAEVIGLVNDDDVSVVSVDIASGIHGNTGKVMGTAVRADLTVTFAAPKIGHLLYPGAEYSGEVVVKDIGIPVEEKNGRTVYMIDKSDPDRLPARDESGNKGTFGKLLVIAGSKNIFGAAYLSAKAALRSGIGMVKVYTEETNRTAVNVLLPEALIDTYSHRDKSFDGLEDALKWADAVLIGPGMGTDETALELLKRFQKLNTKSVVYDADALNLIAREGLSFCKDRADHGQLDTVTPHAAEMSRLTGLSVSEIKEDPIGTALEYAKKHNVVCILKDARTVIAYPDDTVFINTSGCSALATAGSGDVLAGITAAYRLMYRDAGLYTEAVADYVHGTLGQRAAEKADKGSVIAGDLIEMLKYR